MAGSELDADMSVAEVGTEDGGAFPSSEFILLG